MSASRFSLRVSRRIMIVIGYGVALPARLLAGIGVQLTLRIARAIEDESARYNSYIALQVGEAFEQELKSQLRGGMGPAESAARSGGGPGPVRAALEAVPTEFGVAQFVALDGLNG